MVISDRFLPMQNPFPIEMISQFWFSSQTVSKTPVYLSLICSPYLPEQENLKKEIGSWIDRESNSALHTFRLSVRRHVLCRPLPTEELSIFCLQGLCRVTVTEEYLPELPTCGIEPPAQAIRTRTLCFSCQLFQPFT